MADPIKIASTRDLPPNFVCRVESTKFSTRFVGQVNSATSFSLYPSGENYVIIHVDYNESPVRHILSEEEFDQIVQGRIIQCIKLFRERTGYGLKESKDFIDLIRGQNGL